uniref:Uncharacterized protein n=1 Tax=Arundo donax TaxID=35708 RepID=A0A0A9CIF8_ARUDO
MMGVVMAVGGAPRSSMWTRWARRLSWSRGVCESSASASDAVGGWSMQQRRAG